MKKRILIIEDEDSIAELVKFNLEKNGFECERTDSGEAALKMLQKGSSFDLILLDLMLTGMDGTDFCRMFRADTSLRQIPIIMLTARSEESDIVSGLEFGANDYITKPFNMNMLMLRIQKFLDWKAKSQRDLVQRIDIQPKDITISSMDERFMQKAMKLMEENMANTEYSVENFSQDMNVSRTNLYRKMIAITGKSPIEYMRIIRLKRGKQLLMHGYRINETAYNVGFSNPKYFRKYFKEEFGITPAEFLKENQKACVQDDH